MQPKWLSNCSSIRFKAKHNESEKLCGIVHCFKDICKTVVYQHQLSQCMRLAAGNCAAYEISVEQVQVNTVDELVEAESILSKIAGFQRFDDNSHATCVSTCGTEYMKNMVFVLGVDDGPSFCIICKCLILT